MSRIFYLALFVTFLYSCSDPVTDSSGEIDIVDSANVVPTEQATADTLGVHNMSVDDFLHLPFTLSILSNEKWNREEVLEDNTHNPEIKDTVIIEQFKESIIHIVNHHLSDAHIVDSEISLVKDIHVGMSKSQFTEAFSDLMDHKNNPYVHVTEDEIQIGCCEKESDVWTFSFDHDTISAINYASYLD